MLLGAQKRFTFDEEFDLAERFCEVTMAAESASSLDPVNPFWDELVSRGIVSEELRTMRNDCIAKALAGTQSLEEAKRMYIGRARVCIV